ncbi:MAG: glycerol-3-phosphate 1-O-acyltransferase PlsY [Candidatus Heimdallarchaeota archaeon]|nr:glycerol-3-phosphate 1-O-acyltransferase PlsY [Candidatus Heimdallarchaeota archaeon]
MATTVLMIIGLFVLSYLVGSIPPSYIVGKVFFKVDIRKQGSGNVGGANSARLFGKKIGLTVGLFDVFKGYIMIILAKYLVQDLAIEVGLLSDPEFIIAVTGALAVVGHCYSAYLKFTGGKGGATTAGVLVAIHPLTALILVLFWLLIVSTTRFTSLGNLLGIIVVPISIGNLLNSSAYNLLSYFLVILIFFTHRANVGRLLNGTERKFGQKEAIH